MTDNASADLRLTTGRRKTIVELKFVGMSLRGFSSWLENYKGDLGPEDRAALAKIVLAVGEKRRTGDAENPFEPGEALSRTKQPDRLPHAELVRLVHSIESVATATGAEDLEWSKSFIFGWIAEAYRFPSANAVKEAYRRALEAQK